jgi:predicted GNAT superfamily acetyltransferase
MEIRALRTLGEMREAVELQKVFWGSDAESVIPAHMLFSLANHGGHVLAAYDGAVLAGVLIGFLGTHMEDSNRPAMANLQLVSKRMVVLPAYRNQGVGYRLKVAQRELAIKQGVRLIVWTFDPLQALNAHLNIRKLGGICREFCQDYYGTQDTGGLTLLGSSDRLFVEWWVTNRRVDERINGSRGDLGLKHYLDANTPILNATSADARGLCLPASTPVRASGSMALLEIPADYTALVGADVELARAWRAHSRLMLGALMDAGYLVTDFLHETYEGRPRAFYLFSHSGPQFDFSLN